MDLVIIYPKPYSIYLRGTMKFSEPVKAATYKARGLEVRQASLHLEIVLDEHTIIIVITVKTTIRIHGSSNNRNTENDNDNNSSVHM